MSKKIEKSVREVNGISVEQRIDNGFINGTAMCVAHGKLIADWFRNQETFDVIQALLEDLGLEVNYGISHNSTIASISAAYPQLVVSKRGSPKTGGGTWLHPDLSVRLAQWCSPAFAIQVSRWIREWMVTGKNPIWSQDDLDRVGFRANLKDDSRLRMTDRVKVYLEQIKKYDDDKYRGSCFAQVHDAINIAITSETAKDMRNRLSIITGKKIKNHDLIRDYFPSLYLQRYIALCEAAANFMLKDNHHPLTAVEKAAEYFLPNGYIPQPIDFVEHIRFVRLRVNSGQINLPLADK